MALSRTRVFSLRESYGKSEFLDPATPRGKFAKRRTRASFAAVEKRTLVCFFRLREGSCEKRVGSGHVALLAVNLVLADVEGRICT
eukprot:4069674-Prymnesium_polylepis.2